MSNQVTTTNRRVLLISIPSNTLTAKKIKFFSDENIHPYNTIVWDPGFLGYEVYSKFNENLLGLWWEDDWLKVNASITSHLDKLLELVKSGARLIIIVDRALPTVRVVVGDDKRKNIPLTEFPILNYLTLSDCKGEVIEYRGPNELSEPSEVICAYAKHEVRLTNPDLKPLFIAPSTIAGGEFIVGAYVSPQGSDGIILILPTSASWNLNQDTPSENRSQYIEAAIAIATELKPESVPVTYPDWADDFRLPKEHVAREKVSAIQTEIIKLQSEASGLETFFNEQHWTKALFTSKDETLVDAVIKVFRSLGLLAVKGPPNRADLLVRRGDVLAVLEVKGHDGAAKKWQVSQCQSWVDDVEASLTLPSSEHQPIHQQYVKALKELDVHPVSEDDELSVDLKGMIVTNTHRQKRPDQRPKENFPDNMPATISAKGICALTGLQLLCLYADVFEDDKKREEVLDALFKHNGVFESYGVWDNHLKVPESVTEGRPNN